MCLNIRDLILESYKIFIKYDIMLPSRYSLICLTSSELCHMHRFSALRLMTDPLSISITCSCDLRARLICFCTGGSRCAPERAGGLKCAVRLPKDSVNGHAGDQCKPLKIPLGPKGTCCLGLDLCQPSCPGLHLSLCLPCLFLRFYHISSRGSQKSAIIASSVMLAGLRRGGRDQGKRPHETGGKRYMVKLERHLCFSPLKNVENELRPHIMAKPSFLCCSSGDSSHRTFEFKVLDPSVLQTYQGF